MNEYPKVIDIGADMWATSNAAVPTHKVVPADALVIERWELPAVTDQGGGTWRFDTGASLSTWIIKTADDARTEALELLALAEHLDAHPPVDEAQVEALAEALWSAGSNSTAWADISIATQALWIARARRLVELGWTKAGAR